MSAIRIGTHGSSRQASGQRFHARKERLDLDVIGLVGVLPGSTPDRTDVDASSVSGQAHHFVHLSAMTPRPGTPPGPRDEMPTVRMCRGGCGMSKIALHCYGSLACAMANPATSTKKTAPRVAL